MNTWNLSGESNSVYIEFKKDGELYPPDTGSIKLTLRDTSGQIIAGYDKVLLDDTVLTTMLLTFPGSVNVINEGRESRHVRVDYLVGGVPCAYMGSYKLSPFIPLTVTAADVRSILGIREKELLDVEVDLYESYFNLLPANPLLESALLAVDNTAMKANRAVALNAALTLLPSMPARASKEDALNNASLVRASIDWAEVRDAILAELSDCLGALDPNGPVSSFQFTPLLVLTFPTDPVTNT